MISFKFRNQSKRIKIKTQQKLDERMSHWLQKVFGFKSQIIGFKAQDGKFYDVESFYSTVERFFGSNVDIIESGDQLEISFTSQNLNSSSFIRPSQPSEINHNGPSSDDFEDFIIVNDRKSFQKKLIDGKDVSILFDANSIYRKTLIENSNELITPYLPFKTNLYLYVNNSHPKKSCYSIYIGKTCLITLPLLKNYVQKVRNFVSRYKNSSVLAERENKLYLQARASHQHEDQAPSFTTYHLQQRLNQQTCVEYLGKMNREKLLRNYQFHKLIEKCQENFTEFYRIFCEGVMYIFLLFRDNDYESFRNQILHKVQNNLELILSNVDEMDLSRPISRQQQRRNNLKKSVPQIEIVKVENYFQILDQLKSQIENELMGQIKQLLLDQDKEICKLFSDYLSRQITQQNLSKRLVESVLSRNSESSRPISRYVPSRTMKSKSVDPIKRKFSQYKDSQQAKFMNKEEPQQLVQINTEDPPMFGSIRNDENFSPIKYMADTQGTFKYAWNKLSSKNDQFEPEQYGLLYHYLQSKDECIISHIQNLEWKEGECLKQLHVFLKGKINEILANNFTLSELTYLQNNKISPQIACVYDNFRYESNLESFINGLKEQIDRNRPIIEIKTLHKKSSDSQLLDLKDKKNNRYGKRKFSDQNEVHLIPRSPSLKDSEYSLNVKNNDFPNLISSIKMQWSDQFEEMLKDINFSDEKKERHIRQMYAAGSPEVFGWIRNYIKGQQQIFSTSEFQQIKAKQSQRTFLLQIFPIFQQFLALFVQQGLLSDTIRKWLVSEYLQPNMNLVGAFELYLQTKNQEQFIETLSLVYEHQNKDMEFYNTYLKRLQSLLRQMSVHDQIGLQVFDQYPTIIRAICELYFITGDLQDMIETLDVLYQKQTDLRELKVATLNFSGINTSPFEYHDGSQQMKQLDEICNANIKKYYPELKKWNLGKIDKKFQAKRQTICYMEGFKLNNEGKLPNRQEFEGIWRENFKEADLSQEDHSKQQQQECINMDYIIYLSVCQFVYKDDANQDEIQLKLHDLDASKLTKYLAEKKNKPQCKLDIKQQITISYLLKNNIDVLFLQQAGSIEWGESLVKQYGWVKMTDSVIIYNRQKIGGTKQSMMEAWSERLKFNQDSCCLFTNKNYLLISVHLKSSNANIQQAKEMFATIEQILTEHPRLKLIIGIDANHFIEQTSCPNNIRSVPRSEQVPTCIKKRSWLQAQLHKSNLQVCQVKDLIITNREIQSYQVENVQGKALQVGQKQLIPNDRHPYDHFLVKAELK